MAFENTRAVFSAARSVVSDKVGDRIDESRRSGLGRTLEGIRSLAKSGEYARMHGDLSSIISHIRIITSALDPGALTSLEQGAKDAHSAALESGSEEELAAARERLDVLVAIKDLLDGQGQDMAERVLDREVLSREEASEVLSYLKEVTLRTEQLGDDVRISTAGAFESFIDAVGDERLTGTHRAEVAASVAQAMAESKLFRGGAGMAELARVTSETDDLSDAEAAGRVSASLEAMRDKVDAAELVHDLSSMALEQGAGDEDRAETLDSLVLSLSRMDGFAEEQMRLSKAISDDLMGDQDREDELRLILSRVSDRTVEAKTLFTLNQLNDKFDSAVLDTDELSEALEKGGLGREFLENPGSFGGGGAFGNLAQDALTMFLMSTLGPQLGLPLAAAMDAGLGSAVAGGLGTVGGSVATWFAAKRGVKAALPAGAGAAGAPGAAAGAAGKAAAAPAARGGFLSNAARKAAAGLRGLGPRGRVIAGGLTALAGWSAFGGGDEEEIDRDRIDAPGLSPDSPVYVAPVGGDGGVAAPVGDRMASPGDLYSAPGTDAALAAGGIGLALGAAARYGRRPAAAPGPSPKPRVRVGPDGKPRVRMPVPDPASSQAAAKAAAVAPAASPVAGILSKASPAVGMAKAAGKRLLGPALTAWEYAEAESDAERTSALAGGAGGALAAALLGAKAGALAGTVVPGAGNIVGFLAGAAVGVGGYLGGQYLADMYSDAADRIPDSHKGSIFDEVAWINSALSDPGVTGDDRESLMDRKREILTDGVADHVDSIDASLESAGVPIHLRAEALRDSVMMNPAAVSAAPEAVAAVLSEGASRWSGDPAPAAAEADPSSTDASFDSLPPGIDPGGAPVSPATARSHQWFQSLFSAGGSPVPDAAAYAPSAMPDAPVMVSADPITSAIDGVTGPGALADAPSTEYMASLSPQSAAPRPPAAERAPEPRRTGRRAAGRPKTTGAPAPSTTGDDYGVALANSLLFA